MDQDRLRHIANASGFPFQIRVATEIQSKKKEHLWTLEAEERWWELEDTDGFIDLVLAKVQLRIGYRTPVYVAVECKRITDPWVFFPSSQVEPQEDQSDRAYLAGSRSFEPAWWPISVWQIGDSEERGPVAAFCAVGKGRQILERTAGELIRATEGLANRYHRFAVKIDGTQAPALFLPLIVTTAPLYLSEFNPMDIALDKGEIVPDAATFTPVTFIRFRKTFKTADAGERLDDSIQSLQSQRTVWIVHAPELTPFLKAWFLRFEPEFPRNEFHG